jgi:hypothetical protein
MRYTNAPTLEAIRHLSKVAQMAVPALKLIAYDLFSASVSEGILTDCKLFYNHF